MTHKITVRNMEYVADDQKAIIDVSYKVTFYEKYLPTPESTEERTEYATYFDTLILQPPGETFIPFEDITKEVLIEWIEEYGDLSKLKAQAYKEIHSKISGIKYKSFL
jgi:hypothetical protein